MHDTDKEIVKYNIDHARDQRHTKTIRRFLCCNKEVIKDSEGKIVEAEEELTDEQLKEKGYIVVRGKVNTKYFFKKLIYNEE